jgi:hypothetical protein
MSTNNLSFYWHDLSFISTICLLISTVLEMRAREQVVEQYEQPSVVSCGPEELLGGGRGGTKMNVRGRF